jgi:hypothetical protein
MEGGHVAAVQVGIENRAIDLADLAAHQHVGDVVTVSFQVFFRAQ